MKITTRLSLLLMALLGISTLVRVQESAISTAATWGPGYGTGSPTQMYRGISAVPMPDPRNFFKATRARDRSLLWRVHLALQFVKHPKMNDRQVRIILDLISLSTPEFFAASNDTKAKRTKADDALESLARRAFDAFPNSQAAELFAKNPDGETEDDILKMYYDISALPLKKRKASFRNASSSQKSDLWRTHLALVLVKRSLSARQTDIIVFAMSLATREHFEVPFSDPDWKTKVRDPLRGLEEQIVTAFSLEDAAKIFATLGDDPESNRIATYSASVVLRTIKYTPLSEAGPYKIWTYTRFGGQDMELERSACECSTVSDYCPIWKICTSGSCGETQSGCGTFWSHPCNGACR